MERFIFRLSLVSILAVAPGLVGLSSSAQTSPAVPVSGIETYSAEYFEAFAPQTALEMVSRLPGFSIDTGEQRRGFGQGGANILLNGARLSGKSTDPAEQLQQIPAIQVIRIDLIDGATSGIPGLSGPVADIITSANQTSGTWSWSPIFRDQVEPNWGRVAVNLSGRRDELDYSLSVNNTSNRIGSRGPEERVPFSTNEPRTFDEAFSGVASGPTLSASLAWRPHLSWEAKTQVEYSDFNINEREISKRDDGVEQSVFNFGLDRRQGEISTEVSRDFMRGRAKVITLYNFLEDEEASSSLRSSETLPATGNRFLVDLEQTEAIVRAEFDRSLRQGHAYQLAIEYARNELNSVAAFASLDAQGLFQPIALSDAGTNVFEDRAEINATRSWRFHPKTSFQLSLGAEYSKIQQDRETGILERSFFRPKGFAALTFKPSKTLTLSSRLERNVGQLNFFDFTSSIGLREGVDQSGNPDLVPQQDWRAEVELDKRLVSGHVLTANVFYENISDIVDRIPIGDSGDGVGNINRGERWGTELTATLQGKPIGLEGLELDAAFTLADSKLADPIEGFSRRFNGQTLFSYNLELIYDIPQSPWAFGLEALQSENAKVFRATTVDQLDEQPFVSVFFEHKDIWGSKVRASIFNVTDYQFDLDRSIYDRRRDLGTIVETQSRQRTFGPFIQISINGTF